MVSGYGGRFKHKEYGRDLRLMYSNIGAYSLCKWGTLYSIPIFTAFYFADLGKGFSDPPRKFPGVPRALAKDLKQLVKGDWSGMARELTRKGRYGHLRQV